MPNSKQIVYLSQSQYAELIANGSITVDGVTVTYDENDIYVTPQAEPVTDVRVNGTSVASNGVAEIPLATNSSFGVVKPDNEGLIVETFAGKPRLRLVGSSANYYKGGGASNRGVVTSTQHQATFYGLAKVAGHDEKDSTEPLGTYTPEAKGAIQQMLGVSDLIATAENSLVASKAYAIGDVFTANGKLYKVTSAIAADGAIVLQNEGEEVAGANAIETKVGEGFVKKTDFATYENPGVFTTHPNFGLNTNPSNNGILYISGAAEVEMKSGNYSYKPITTSGQHIAAFYGLAKAAGTDEKNSTLPVGQYTDTAKTAIRSMIGATSPNVIAVQDTQPTDADTKIWLPETAETPVEVPTVAEMNAALATKMSAVFEGDGLVIISGESVWNGGEY